MVGAVGLRNAAAFRVLHKPLLRHGAVDVAGHGLREHGMDPKGLQQLAGHEDAYQRRPFRMTQGFQDRLHGLPGHKLPGGAQGFLRKMVQLQLLSPVRGHQQFSGPLRMLPDQAADIASKLFDHAAHRSSIPTSRSFPSTASPQPPGHGNTVQLCIEPFLAHGCVHRASPHQEQVLPVVREKS